MSEGEGGEPAVIATATFSNIVVIVTVITAVCLLLWVGLAVLIDNPTATQSTLIEGVSRGFAGGFGALLGLLGGKLS